MTQFRADRFATLNLFRHLGRGGLRGGEQRIPILMYHSISETTQNVHPYFLTETSATVFAEQMKYLHENGYSAISLDEVVVLLIRNRLQKPENMSSLHSTTVTAIFTPKRFPSCRSTDLTQRFSSPLSILGSERKVSRRKTA